MILQPRIEIEEKKYKKFVEIAKRAGISYTALLSYIVEKAIETPEEHIKQFAKKILEEWNI